MNGDKYRKTYKVCESTSKRMVIVKLWVNSDKHRKIECLWSNEEMVDEVICSPIICQMTHYMPFLSLCPACLIFSMFVSLSPFIYS
jgi:hypothetical protein